MILWYQYKEQNWAVFPSPINPSYLIIGPPSSTKFMLPIDPKSRVNATKFVYRNPTSLVPILRKSTCKFTMALPFFLSFSCLSFVCFLSLFVCFHFLCVCVSVLFCIVFVLLKLVVLQHILFKKAHNMLRFLIETLRELSVIGLMTTRFQKIFANALFGCCKKKYNSRSRIEIEKKNKKRINGIVLPQMHVLESR